MSCLCVGLGMWSAGVVLTGVGWAQAPTGSLSGRVVARESNQPIAGAKVTVTRSVTKDAYTGETDAKGEFRLGDLPPGNYVVEIDAEGRTGIRLNVLQTVEAGKTTALKTPFKLEVERTYSVIRGAVFNERGLTMPGVTVVAERVSSSDPSLKPGKVGTAVTNSAGEFAFRFPGADAVYRLTAQAKGYRTQTKALDVQKREARNMAFQLEPEPPRKDRANE
ncbi:MAG: carboxypeptidase-like regulatory domain-containing protein [Chloracidobacterium sp.]|nr:carboxypeptidase-like regulatory domain-containing protein [Chloracidobacterium sp.]MDW8218099.1 carboxypeptidase-like regulatory domain-containing protein [Acidobacteriota bacterium]